MFHQESNNLSFCNDFLCYAIFITGWAYFILWVGSTYPQVITNFKLKSVAGLSFNYVTFSTLGFAAYLVYNVCLFFIPSFQSAYHTTYPNSTHVPVYINDVAFSIHAFIINVILCLQCFIYEHGNQSLHIFTKLCVLTVMMGAFMVILFTYNYHLNLLTVAYYFSTVKLVITLFKCTPQIYHNYRRKSTKGWSIIAVLTDFAGGTLSIFQMLLSAWKENNWNAFFGNSGKVGLGIISIVFDVIFMVQHYCFYSEAFCQDDLINEDSNRKSCSIGKPSANSKENLPDENYNTLN